MMNGNNLIHCYFNGIYLFQFDEKFFKKIFSKNYIVDFLSKNNELKITDQKKIYNFILKYKSYLRDYNNIYINEQKYIEKNIGKELYFF